MYKKSHERLGDKTSAILQIFCQFLYRIHHKYPFVTNTLIITQNQIVAVLLQFKSGNIEFHC